MQKLEKYSAIQKTRYDASCKPFSIRLVLIIGSCLLFGGFAVPSARPLAGSAQQIADGIAAFAADGVEHLSLMLQPWTVAGIEVFAKVIEALRR